VAEKILVEVAYGLPEQQFLLNLSVAKDCTAIEAVRLSGIFELCPELEVSLETSLETEGNALKLGIFSQSCEHDRQLNAGDRVEIYRPLLMDPKESRKLRAAKMAKRKQQQS